MAIDPIGDNTYKGLGIPAYGESKIEQQNSSNTLLTLVHSSANTGRFLMGMDYRADQASSLLTDLVLWEIDVDGGFKVMSGTTVIFELDSSGFYEGTTQIFDADGNFSKSLGRKSVVAVTTASSNYSAVSSQSGTLFYYSSVETSGQNFSLPGQLANAGVYFDIYVSSMADATAFTITTTNDSTARFYINSIGASTVSSAIAIGPNTTNAGGVRVIALTTNTWTAQPWFYLASSYDATTAIIVDNRTVGLWTTIAAMV